MRSNQPCPLSAIFLELKLVVWRVRPTISFRGIDGTHGIGLARRLARGADARADGDNRARYKRRASPRGIGCSRFLQRQAKSPSTA